MKDELVRFGIAMEGSLLDAFDEVVKSRGGSRSEAFRDLARAEVGRAQVRRGLSAVGTLTIVYDHHVRELTEKLTDMQHELGSAVQCSTHVHLDAHRCLEVIVLKGRADALQAVADRIRATRGVIHGALELVTDVPHKNTRRRGEEPHVHPHVEPHPHPDHAAPNRTHEHAHLEPARAPLREPRSPRAGSLKTKVANKRLSTKS